MSTGRPVTQDAIEQALDRLAALGLPVDDIAETMGDLWGQLGSLNLSDILDKVAAIDPGQLDVGETLAELRSKYDDLDPALKVPVAIAAGFVGARMVRWIVR